MPNSGDLQPIARELYPRERIALTRAVACADSTTDIVLLGGVGHPVAARRRVRLHARRDSWEMSESRP